MLTNSRAGTLFVVAAVALLMLSGCESLTHMQRKVALDALVTRATTEQMLQVRRLAPEVATSISNTIKALETESHTALAKRSRKLMRAAKAGMAAEKLYVQTREKVK